jgi:carbamoyltransferase
LLEDGEIRFAAEAERYTRIKHDTAFPREALLEAIRDYGPPDKRIHYVGFYTDLRGISLETCYHLIRYLPHSLLFLRNITSYFRHQSLKNELKNAIGYAPAVLPIKHHLAHAASSFYVSPFERSAILTLDGTGEFTTATFGIGEDTEIRILEEIKYPHSLGKLYETFTQYLGFRPNSGEGKVMGLSSYGEPESFLPVFRRIIREGPAGTFKMDMSFFSYHYAGKNLYSRKLVKAFGPPRIAEGPIEKRHQDIAAALQRRVEEIAVHMARHLYEETKSPNLCLAGGVCLNCQMNSVILDQTPFEKLFVPPPAGDPGTAIGAAKAIYYGRCKGRRREAVESAFLGPEFSDEACLQSLAGRPLESGTLEDPVPTCAGLLAKSKIVGWFQGRMEIGPRALGNRSILADPRDPHMKDILNQRVKFREGFRPFAPAILEERCEEFFGTNVPSPFMLRAYRVRPEKRDLIPAVVHVDGTCRVQTVNQAHHPLLYRLIKHFESLTGIPVILNTSFNLRGEPIVRTPADALDTFLRCDMDALFLGRVLVRKEPSTDR